MNVFKTLPRVIDVFATFLAFDSYSPELDRLREVGDLEGERKLIVHAESELVKSLENKIKLTYEASGEENFPESGPFMIYSNHQSFADIAALLWLMTRHGMQLGFVAKDDWKKRKLIASMVDHTRSIYLTRNNSRAAVAALTDAKAMLDKGFNLAIFPEGTRSQKHEMGEFKPGAFKFAEKAKVPVLPVTLDGGYHLFEEKHSYQPTKVKLTVHPMVHLEEMSKQEQKEAQKEIEAAIRSAL